MPTSRTTEYTGSLLGACRLCGVLLALIALPQILFAAVIFDAPATRAGGTGGAQRSASRIFGGFCTTLHRLDSHMPGRSRGDRTARTAAVASTGPRTRIARSPAHDAILPETAARALANNEAANNPRADGGPAASWGRAQASPDRFQGARRRGGTSPNSSILLSSLDGGIPGAWVHLRPRGAVSRGITTATFGGGITPTPTFRASDLGALNPQGGGSQSHRVECVTGNDQRMIDSDPDVVCGPRAGVCRTRGIFKSRRFHP